MRYHKKFVTFIAAAILCASGCAQEEPSSDLSELIAVLGGEPDALDVANGIAVATWNGIPSQGVAQLILRGEDGSKKYNSFQVNGLLYQRVAGDSNEITYKSAEPSDSGRDCITIILEGPDEESDLTTAVIKFGALVD